MLKKCVTALAVAIMCIQPLSHAKDHARTDALHAPIPGSSVLQNLQTHPRSENGRKRLPPETQTVARLKKNWHDSDESYTSSPHLQVDAARSIAGQHIGISNVQDSFLRSKAIVRATGRVQHDTILRASDGFDFGTSVSAAGDVVALGWGSRGLLSSSGDLGGRFYARETGGARIDAGARELVQVSTSKISACFSTNQSIGCYTFSANQTREWVAAPLLREEFSLCSHELGLSCNPVSMSVWTNMVAFTVNRNDGTRLVRVFAIELNTTHGSSSSIEWSCSSGCGADAEDSHLKSPQPSFGNALALEEGMLLVGTPMAEAESGLVEVWELENSSTIRQRWTMSRRILEPNAKRFGGSLSLDDNVLAVGALGDATQEAGVYIYEVKRNLGSTLAVDKICVVRDDNHDANWVQESGFGSSLAIRKNGSVTMVVVGAHLSGEVYVVLVWGSTCSVPYTLKAPDATQGYGSSVAIAHHHIFIGAPRYFNTNWDGSVTSGLVYVSSICLPGERLTTVSAAAASDGLEHSICESCLPGSTSSGGQASLCFGCQTQKPANSRWVSGYPGCQWDCVEGWERGGTAECHRCPGDAAEHNAEWLPGTCSWRCARGYFNDSDSEAPNSNLNPHCLRCSELKTAQAANKPEHSEWVDALDECGFGPAMGFRKCTESECLPCDPLPENSAWSDTSTSFDDRCEFTCNTGFFGHPTVQGICAQCSELLTAVLEVAVRPQLPARALWDDGSSVCNASSWACADGFVRSEVAEFCCPTHVAHAVVDETLAPCQAACNAGYFWDDELANCKECPPRPSNADWTSGCWFAPRAGYWCSAGTSDAECLPCSTWKPENSRWRTVTLPESLQSPCAYECLAGYFGAQCLTCSALVSAQGAGTSLPANAVWSEVNGTCNADTWHCNTGFHRSTDPSFCCPDEIPHSTLDATRSPCKVACDEGYGWEASQAACAQCPAKPLNSHWTSDCYFRCNPGFHPTASWLCLSCAEFRDAANASLPPHAFWDSSNDSCDEDDWHCDDGYFKSTRATPPGCCPNRVPPGARVDSQAASTCFLECKEGFQWDSREKTCSHCSELLPPPPAHANFGYDCEIKCDAGFMLVHVSRGSSVEYLSCVNCPDYAARMMWAKPWGSVWPENSRRPCSSEAWECVQGLTRHGSLPTCCPADSVYIPEDLVERSNGDWDPSLCTWRCNRGHFPSIPVPELANNCMTCEAYLASQSVSDDKCDSFCIGRTRVRDPDECFAVIYGVVTLRMELSLTELQAVEIAFRETLSENLILKGAEVYTALLQEEQEETLNGQILVSVDRIEPWLTQRALSNISAMTIWIDKWRSIQVGFSHLEASSGSGRWICGHGYTFNNYTNRCCKSPFYVLPSDVSPDRVAWSKNGCDWQCRPSFSGFGCRTCAEHNSFMQRETPINAVWVEGSEGCSEWGCKKGYVKTSKAYGCAPLAEMKKRCESNTRCATCTRDGDCTWCGGTCRPGRQLAHIGSQSRVGCPLDDNGLVETSCACDWGHCTAECQHSSCSSCAHDPECGWCLSSQRCMMGDTVRPYEERCDSGWVVWEGSSSCKDTGLPTTYLIALIAGAVAALCIGAYLLWLAHMFRTRSRRTIEQRTNQLQAQSEAARAATLILPSLPTFSYMPGAAGQGRIRGLCSPSAGPGDGDEDEEEDLCSICLAAFATGDSCMMLPCMHVFHQTCISKWFAVSDVCPLCKRSVLDPLPHNNAGVFSEVQMESFLRAPQTPAPVLAQGIILRDEDDADDDAEDESPPPQPAVVPVPLIHPLPRPLALPSPAPNPLSVPLMPRGLPPVVEGSDEDGSVGSSVVRQSADIAHSPSARAEVVSVRVDADREVYL